MLYFYATQSRDLVTLTFDIVTLVVSYVHTRPTYQF